MGLRESHHDLGSEHLLRVIYSDLALYMVSDCCNFTRLKFLLQVRYSGPLSSRYSAL